MGLLAAPLVAAGVVTAAGAAEPTGPPTAAMTAVPTAPFALHRGPVRRERVDALEAAMTPDARVGVTAVLTDANRRGGPCVSAAAAPGALEPTCFEGEPATGDSATRAWFPQGITGSGDATADGLWNGRRVRLVSWYRKAGASNVRISFVRDDGTYRHVLLVVPNGAGTPDYRPVHAHAGGIAWYGDKLYVAATGRGVRVFDVDDIIDLGKARNGSTSRPDLVGLHDGVYHGNGYRYVMPQVGSYVLDDRAGPGCGDGRPKFSYLAVDRTSAPDSLVAGEYCNPDGAAENDQRTYGRVARWRFDGNALALNAVGRAVPTSAYRLPASNIQGAVPVDGTWHFSRSNGRDPGWFLAARPGQPPVVRAGGTGIEDLYAPAGEQRLYTVTEHPGGRVIFAVALPL